MLTSKHFTIFRLAKSSAMVSRIDMSLSPDRNLQVQSEVPLMIELDKYLHTTLGELFRVQPQPTIQPWSATTNANPSINIPPALRRLRFHIKIQILLDFI